MRRRDAGLALAALALTLPGAATAQSWPDKPIKLVVPYPPGASTDALGRIVAQKVSASLGQPVVVDNRAGASGNIGTEVVARAPADGYTFGLGTDATHASNVHLAANPSFQPLRDFTPLALAATNPIALVVHPSIPANNLAELIAYVKSNPDKGAYGSSGTGSPHHLAGELLRSRTGAPFTHVPYKGGGPALNDVMGAQIPMLFASAITVIPHIQSGRVRAIAITSPTRYEGLPNVPTMGETLTGFEMPSWLAFFGPANLPEPVARRLSDEILKALRDPEVKAKLTSSGLAVVAGGPADLAATQRKDYELKGRLIREAGVKAD
ncbi:MAG: BUG/TctC family periplasmic protein [uncultured Ramlibacter sp.]|uniref:BUG/TctC family periplasmic protein n=1 Tax=uncultured Ramlibacter sp. TaxID=260755 RepID=A0A6J4PM04_9BURK|nr:MAG: BUG/TctC family periplasmic protein [uncultured Ramlibacter sp.]